MCTLHSLQRRLGTWNKLNEWFDSIQQYDIMHRYVMFVVLDGTLNLLFADFFFFFFFFLKNDLFEL